VIYTFFKSEVLLIHLVLLNSMCLHAIVCGTLRAIKFDIGFMVPYLCNNKIMNK